MIMEKMSKVEYLRKAMEAVRYCMDNRLFRSKQEIERLKEQGKLSLTAMCRMRLHKERQEELRKSE